MLTELRISNFALIDQLHLEFPRGFLVFTGETGAGKSLLIDALLLLVGGRASSEHIRFNTEEALLEACFLLGSTHPLLNELREHGYLLSDQREIVVRRILSRSGKNRIYLNGQLASLQTLQSLGTQLIDIHGQHDQQSLLSAKTQLALLDAFGGLGKDAFAYRRQYEEWMEKRRALEEFQDRAKSTDDRREILQYQYDELTGLNLEEGEEEDLSQEYQRMKHAGRLRELSHQAYTALLEQDGSILDQLGQVQSWVEELAEIDPQNHSWAPLVDSITIAARELTDNLRDYQSQMDFDPSRMEVIDTRIATIQRIKKKYGKTVSELKGMIASLEKDLDCLQHSEGYLAKLEEEVQRGKHTLEGLGKTLSQKRQKIAMVLETSIKKELISLNMHEVQFRVMVSESVGEEAFGLTGMNRVQMEFSANPGEPLQPLGRIASGGELSRVMLALKTVFAGHDQVPVVIFDEIDSGVGGEAGRVMGTRLRQLAEFHQVCCVTHLPQIASQGHVHYFLEKKTSNNRTQTVVRELRGMSRQTEIARMLGGGTLTPSLKKTAEEMLNAGTCL